MKKFTIWLSKPTAPFGLAIFRILFGVIMLWDVLRINSIGLIDSFYPRGIVFPYAINLPLPEQETLKAMLFVLGISAILITLGIMYRVAMTFFALFFSYFFFLDQTLYNNHLYLICLISFMMIFMPADAALSFNKKRHRATIPQWSYRLLQFQLVVVYFFGAVSKMNPYWFDMHPVQELLQIRAEKSGTSFLSSQGMQYFVAYGGLLFDLFIGFLLWMRKTRKIAIVAAGLFSLTNAYLFDDIYIFPFFMIGASILFIDQKWLASKFKNKNTPIKVVKNKALKETEVTPRVLHSWGTAVIVIYAVVQLILPLRHFFIPGYTDWTSDAQRFSWRMKIQTREVEEMEFSIWDFATKQVYDVNPNEHLYPDEIQQMANSPHMIVQFAFYLEKVAAEKARIKKCMVKSKVKVKFNGRPAQYIFDPELDLLEESTKHDHYYEWVNALK